MRLVVFDMDGTLVDSAAVMVQSAIAACQKLGVTPPSDKKIRSISGLALLGGLRLLAPEADDKMLEEMVEVYKQAYRDAVEQDSREHLFPGTKETLERLHAEPETILAVATGKGYSGAMRVLEMHSIIDLFNSVETPDHNPSKPHPGMLHAAMRKAGVVESQTIMIGDTVHDMDMAQAANVPAIGVSFGYHLPSELTERGAACVIDEYSELEAAITNCLENTRA